MPGGDTAPLAHGQQHWLELGGVGGVPGQARNEGFIVGSVVPVVSQGRRCDAADTRAR